MDLKRQTKGKLFSNLTQCRHPNWIRNNISDLSTRSPCFVDPNEQEMCLSFQNIRYWLAVWVNSVNIVGADKACYSFKVIDG